MPVVEIKYFTVLIDNKPLFDQPAKSKQEANEKRIEITRNMTIQQEIYWIICIIKAIGIDLSRQTNTNIPQQINFEK